MEEKDAGLLGLGGPTALLLACGGVGLLGGPFLPTDGGEGRLGYFLAVVVDCLLAPEPSLLCSSDETGALNDESLVYPFLIGGGCGRLVRVLVIVAVDG